MCQNILVCWVKVSNGIPEAYKLTLSEIIIAESIYSPARDHSHGTHAHAERPIPPDREQRNSRTFHTNNRDRSRSPPGLRR